MLRLFCVLFVALISMGGQAGELERYPHSQSLDEQQQWVRNQHLVASSIRKVSGRLRVSEEIWVDGDRQRLLLQLPDGHSVDDGIGYYRRQLEQQSAKTLFECAGRGCGPSNLWANDVFKQARVYGPDKDQRYSLSLMPGDTPTYAVLYGIRRGNGRVLILLDQVRPGAETSQLTGVDRVVAQLESRGFYDLNGAWLVGGSLQSMPEFELLRELLHTHKELKLALVGQSPALRLTEAEWKAALTSSSDMVMQLKTALVEAGVAPERLQTFGVGPVISQESGSAEPGLRLLRLSE